MDAIKVSVNKLILNPNLAPFLTILKAARNGAVYGTKVRFPHALVMVFLFRSGTFKEKVIAVLKATRQHARNLARFAAIYKTAMLALRYLNLANSGKEGQYDSFLSGLLGGYIVFGSGRQGSVNQQICIYVFARVVLSLAKILVQGPVPDPSFAYPSALSPLQPSPPLLSPAARETISANAWPVFASLSWAFVMYLFRWYPDSIQPSLRSSMKYIYVNADHWDSFRNFLIHNV